VQGRRDGLAPCPEAAATTAHEFRIKPLGVGADERVCVVTRVERTKVVDPLADAHELDR
jgi:hypothetical protein